MIIIINYYYYYFYYYGGGGDDDDDNNNNNNNKSVVIFTLRPYVWISKLLCCHYIYQSYLTSKFQPAKTFFLISDNI